MAKKVSPLRFCIDISDNKVSLIKTNKSGRIVKAATAELPEIPETINDAYTSAVTRAIKKAARKARIPKSFGMPCVMVTGGPNVVVRHFVWPDMTAEAFRSNLETEIAPYLPDDSGEYTIGYRISKRNDPNGSLSAAVDVLAAAVPLDLSNSYVKAAKKAGYKVQRIDLRENARNKLVGASPLTNKFSSYAILDISSRQINMAVYLEGVFYSNRYFAPIKNDVSNEQHDDDGLWQDAATDSVSALESATDMLVNEVSSIINYLQYRERGSNVECILLYGDENIMPHIMQSLAENLEMPVYKTEEWIKQSEKYEFMDAYGALLLPSGTSVYKKSDINLKAYKKPGAGRQMLVPAICMFIILCALNTVGIVIPRAELIEKQKIVKSLEVQLAAYPVTESQLAAVRRECDSLRQEIINVSGSGNDLQIFFSEYPQAFATLPAVSFLQWGEQVILNVNVNNGVMTVYCETHDLLRASMSLDFLRQHRLFSGAGTQNINTAATYGLTIELQRGTGVR